MRWPAKKKVWLLLGVGGAIILGSTWTFGMGRVYYASNVRTPCITVPPGREHRAKPGCAGISTVGQMSAPMSFNSLGLRDKEYSAKPPKGVFRILMLGSSTALGVAVKEQNTLPRQLESVLRERKTKIEVINGATVGYCAIQTALRLRELLDAYHPSLVLFDYPYGNCPIFDGAWNDRVTFENGAPVSLDRVPFRFLSESGRAYIYRNENLFFALLTALDQVKKIAFSWKAILSHTEEARARAFLGPSLHFLDFMRRESEQRGARFAVTTHSMAIFTQSIPGGFNQLIVQLLSPFIVSPGLSKDVFFNTLRGGGVQVLGPFNVDKQTLIPGDEHFSDEGYRTLSRMIAEEMGKIGTLPL